MEFKYIPYEIGESEFKSCMDFYFRLSSYGFTLTIEELCKMPDYRWLLKSRDHILDFLTIEDLQRWFHGFEHGFKARENNL